MKRILLPLLLSLLPIVLFAANDEKKAHINVKVVDAVTEYPIKSAKITVMDSLGTVLRDSVGYTAYDGFRSAYESVYFSDWMVLQPKYKVTISAGGYETQYFDVTTPDDATVNLGTVMMHHPRKELRLSEVTVTATRIKMVMKGDTLEYDATAFQLQDGSMLDGLIAALPGAQLDNDGRISVNGRFVSELLVNGRKFFDGDPQVALSNLPAYTVKNVQVYQKTPDEYADIKDRDRSNDPLVMDVNLKKEYMNGWIANAEGGIGSSLVDGWDSRWMGRLFAMRYDKYSYIALHSSANNLNDPQRAGSKGQWSKPKSTSGEITTKRIGLEYNTDWHDQGGNGINTKFDVVRQNTFNSVETLGEAYLTGGNSFTRSASGSVRDTWQGTWSGEISRRFDIFLQRLWFGIDLKYENGKLRRTSASAESSSILPDNFTEPGTADFVSDMLYLRQQTTNQREHSFNHHYRAIVSLKEGFSVIGNASVTRATNYAEGSDVISYFTDSQLDINRLRRDDTPASNYTYAITPSWRKWSKSLSLYASYEYSQEFHRGERTLEEMNREEDDLAPSMADTWAMDYANSYRTTHRAWTNSLNASVSYRWGGADRDKYSVEFTGTADAVARHLNDFRNLAEHTLRRNDWRFSGRLNLVKGNNWWGNGYGLDLRLNQELPDIMQLLDVRDSSNPLVLNLGNPELRRSTTRSATLFFRHEFNKNNRNVSADIVYSATDNALAMARTFNRSTGVTTWQPCNINGNWKITGDFYYRATVLKGLNLTFENSLKPQYARSADFSSDGDVPARSEVDNWRIRNDFKLNYAIIPELKVSAKVNVEWTSLHSRSGLYATFDYTDVNYGVGVTYTLPGGIDLDTDLMAYGRRGYEDPTMNGTDLVWNLQLSKSFGRSKQFTVKAIGFDLLHQLPTVMRVVNAQGSTETRYNSQPSYAIITLGYRLDIKPRRN